MYRAIYTPVSKDNSLRVRKVSKGGSWPVSILDWFTWQGLQCKLEQADTLGDPLPGDSHCPSVVMLTVHSSFARKTCPRLGEPRRPEIKPAEDFLRLEEILNCLFRTPINSIVPALQKSCCKVQNLANSILSRILCHALLGLNFVQDFWNTPFETQNFAVKRTVFLCLIN